MPRNSVKKHRLPPGSWVIVKCRGGNYMDAQINNILMKKIFKLKLMQKFMLKKISNV